MQVLKTVKIKIFKNCSNLYEVLFWGKTLKIKLVNTKNVQIPSIKKLLGKTKVISKSLWKIEK